MKERPILFSSEMVKAILDGRKTQTRRVIKIQPPTKYYKISTVLDTTGNREKIGKHFWYCEDMLKPHNVYFSCPYGKVGDLLWVKTRHYKGTDSRGDIIIWDSFTRTIRWQIEGVGDVENCEPELLQTKRFKFLSSRFMPKWAARIWLEITNIRVERLQDISDADAKSEGVIIRNIGETYWRAFRELWDSINLKRSFGWEVNPYVWVIEFRKSGK